MNTSKIEIKESWIRVENAEEMAIGSVSTLYPDHYAIFEITRIVDGFRQRGRVLYLLDDGYDAINLQFDFYDEGNMNIRAIAGVDLPWQI
ncbi:MAG: hypothetical protein FWG65_13565 [Turicibacter sp.]|nr:hypothetical protein [Turicibacter sp.]